MVTLNYTVPVAPVTKKNSQQILTNPKNGRPFIVPSKAYKEYEDKAGWFLKPRPVKPISEPVQVKCLFYMPTHRRVDLNNLLSAATDVLVKHKILADDNCEIIVSHDGSRVLYDKANPRTEIEISPMETENKQLTML